MRLFQSVQAKLILIYLLLILLAMQLIGVYFIRQLESYFSDNFSETLNKQGNLLAFNLERYLTGDKAKGSLPNPDIDYLVKNLFDLSGGEVQVIDQNGIVVSTSSEENRWVIGQKNTQTEVTRALLGTRDEVIRVDGQTGHRKKFLAIPIKKDNKVLGAVFMVASMENLYSSMNYINEILITGTLIALVFTVFIGVLLSRTITNPVKEITKQAKAMAGGDFNRQVKIYSGDEIGQLGEAFNHLTTRLKDALFQNEEERERLTSVLANMSDGVMATDGEGRVMLINRRAQEMLQKEEYEVIGKEISGILDLAKDQVDHLVFGENRSTVLTVQYPQSREEGFIRATFTPIKKRAQGVSGTIIVLQDVTEQERLDRSRKEFVANVSHELRTPLTTIKSYLEALEDGAWEDRELAPRFLHVTHQETERMIRLVTDLLHLSRLDAKEARLKKESVNIIEMLEEVSDRFAFQLKQRQIEMELHFQLPIPSTLMDRDQIDQVLDNLISNAFKYTGEGGTIRLYAHSPSQQWIEVTVEDTGIGIPHKDLKKIFDRFYRVDKARSRNMGGTGLGLSIAQEIVRAHGGHIIIDSDTNQGTRVTFQLPVTEEGRQVG